MHRRVQSEPMVATTPEVDKKRARKGSAETDSWVSMHVDPGYAELRNYDKQSGMQRKGRKGQGGRVGGHANDPLRVVLKKKPMKERGVEPEEMDSTKDRPSRTWTRGLRRTMVERKGSSTERNGDHVRCRAAGGRTSLAMAIVWPLALSASLASLGGPAFGPRLMDRLHRDRRRWRSSCRADGRVIRR